MKLSSKQNWVYVAQVIVAFITAYFHSVLTYTFLRSTGIVLSQAEVFVRAFTPVLISILGLLTVQQFTPKNVINYNDRKSYLPFSITFIISLILFLSFQEKIVHFFN